MKVLRVAAPSACGMVEVDARGEPIWNEPKHGEFVVKATRIDKRTVWRLVMSDDISLRR